MSGEKAASSGVIRAKACNASGGTSEAQNNLFPPTSGDNSKIKLSLLVLLSFLLDIADFLSYLLQCVFVSAVLHLEVCNKKITSQKSDLPECFMRDWLPCCLLAGAA